jgi:hypothetical protein
MMKGLRVGLILGGVLAIAISAHATHKKKIGSGSTTARAALKANRE